MSAADRLEYLSTFMRKVIHDDKDAALLRNVAELVRACDDYVADSIYPVRILKHRHYAICDALAKLQAE